MVKKRTRRLKTAPQLIGNAMYALLEKMGGVPAKSRLAGLWENWLEIMGPEIAGLICNYGNRGEVLILCAENSLQMQNLQFMAPEALERANAFLGSAYFTGVRVSLYGAEKKRARQEGEIATPAVIAPPRQCAATGKFLADMDMASPVARCYAMFAARRK